MSISKLKDDARRHELREEWEKAVQVYLQVLIQAERGEGEVELPLYNRIGDLYIRLSKPQDAVRYYEQAADKYADAGLYNNAIALCNKALRYEPAHLSLLRKLGIFSALQGFNTDARRYFIDYADKQAAQGRGDEALRALEEYHKIAGSADSHELYGRRLYEHGRTREGLAQLRAAYDLRAGAGETERAEALRAELLTLDPAIRFADEPAAPAAEPTASVGDQRDQHEARPADQFEVHTPAGHEIEIEHTSFEPAVSGFGMIDIDTADTHQVSDTAVGYGALEGLEHTTVDFAAAGEAVQEQDLGTGFEREETAFIAPAPEASAETEENVELPLLEDPAELPLLPDVDLGLPAHAEEKPADYGFAGANPDAPLLDLSALENGGLLLPSLDDTAQSDQLSDDPDAIADFDLPLVTDTFEESDVEETALEFAAQPDAADLIDLDAFTDLDAPTVFDQLQDEPVDDVREPVLDEPEISGFDEIAVELQAEPAVEDDRVPDFDMEFEPPPSRQRMEEPPVAPSDAGSDRTFADWPEDSADIAAAYEVTDATWSDDALHDFADDSAALIEVEDVSRWEEDAAAAADELSAVAASLTEAVIVEADDVITEPDVGAEDTFEYAEPDAGITLDDLEQTEAAAADVADISETPTVPFEDSAADIADTTAESIAAASADGEFETAAPATESAHPDQATEPWRTREETESDTSDEADEEAADEMIAPAVEIAAPVMSSGMAAHADQPAAVSKQPPREEGYVDLGALLVDEEEETTRFRIQETDPSGDEDQDFAELLGRFKEKVAQHLPPEDAAAHYDLGLAFKEMGLIDEAIAEFQVALRTGPMRLKVYEEIGQCFLLKEQYNIAEKVLRQALQVDHQHELDLIGIYYQLGRAYEALSKREQARDAYERVLGMDLNFQDTAERLARL